MYKWEKHTPYTPKYKSPVAVGIILKFRTKGTEQDLIGTAHGRFNWVIKKAKFGKTTSHGWRGYIVTMNGEKAFYCNWLRDFKPAVRHLEQTYQGKNNNEFYDICKSGDIWSLNTRLFSSDTLEVLETKIRAKKIAPITTRKESKRDRERRLKRAIKQEAKRAKLNQGGTK